MAEMKIRIGSDVAEGIAGIKNVNAALNTITPATQKAAAALKNIKPAANSASTALINTGRVLQDSAYGFIGIANNLNPLLESFQRLKAETGTTKGALSALASSLTGAGGLGLVVSAITAAVSFATIGFDAWTRGLFSNKKAIDEVKKANDELLKAIKPIGDVQNEAVGSQQGQISQVQALASVIENTNKSYRERINALNQLKEINKSYFGDLSLEASQLGILKKRVEEYSQAIIQQSIVKKLSDEIASVAIAAAKAQDEVKKAKDAVGRAQSDLNKVVAENQKKVASNVPGVASSAVVQNLNTVAAATQKVTEAEKVRDQVRDTTVRLQEQQLALQDKLNKAVEAGLKLRPLDTGGGGGGKTALEKEIDALKKQISDLEELKKLGGFFRKDEFQLIDLKIRLSIAENLQDKSLNPEQLQRKIDEIIRNADVRAKIPAIIGPTKQSIDGIVSSIQKGFGELNPNIKAPEISGVSKLIEDAGKVASQFALIQENAAKLQDFLTNSLGTAFTNLFDTILSGGKSAFEQFSQAVLGVVKRLIAAAITAAVFAAIIGAATGGANFGGGKGNFLGGFKSLFSQLGGLKLAKGGITTGPTYAMIGDNPSGKEAVIPFERMGEFLRMTGGVGTGYVAETRISGDELLILINRAERRSGKLR